ncbi:toxin YdaT family protein [Yersinia hibernica]|uniref:tRNA-(Guanine-N1)-methyltransferase n=1 Tax=Yersinia enterocolitica LC20 TaxID=1443113 RepID=A0A7U4K0X4_YEREN|nr:toxin YdaT family protein [Yersinia hibernica]AHM73504.1 tRNA-(guanine-N1)-methyltransferase [Yersinia hibernica]
MEQEIKALKAEVQAWAAERGQEHVAIEISRMFFVLNINTGSVRLTPIENGQGGADWKSINNNRQQLFRWLRGDSKASMRKVLELSPVLKAALPAERRARVNGETVNYLVSIASREFAAAISAVLLDGCDMSQRISGAVAALHAIRPQHHRLTTV